MRNWRRKVRDLRWLLLALGLLTGGCRSATVDPALSSRWVELRESPPPFAALYRLTCCGQRELPTVIRSDGGQLAVAVSVPPGGVAWEAWFGGSVGVARRGGERCVVELPLDRAPLPGGARLPLHPSLWVRLLAGRVPPGLEPLHERSGWLGGEMSGGRLLARCGGEPPRCTEVRVEEEGLAVLAIRLDRHHGRLPGRIRASVGRERVVLELMEWGSGTALPAPEWLGWPRCAP